MTLSGQPAKTPQLGVVYPWASPFMFTKFVERSLNMQAPPGWAMRWFRGDGWCPARRHIDGCEQALAWGADLLCIVGSDQVHPEDLFPRLVQRMADGYDVVAALVPSRGYIGWNAGMRPFQPMAWRFKTHEGDALTCRPYRGQDQDGDMIEIVVPQPGVEMERVHFIGSGVVLFQRDHLLALRRPWFSETVDPETQQRIACMDTKWIWRLQMEAGARVWVDTTIPVEHAHVFAINDTYQDRFADWAVGAGRPDLAICKYGTEEEARRGTTNGQTTEGVAGAPGAALRDQG